MAPLYRPRVAIVTGAAQGIGYSIARRLADDGLDIAVNDISNKQERLKEVVEEIKSKGRKCIAVPADVSSELEVKDMIQRVGEELGSVDIMVANAGIALHATLLETSVEQLDHVMTTNYRSVFLCYKYAALQMMKEEHGGRLIAASSGCGKEGFPYAGAYCGSKFAIRGITQVAAKEFGEYGITVNAYCPGFIRTPMTLTAAESEEESMTFLKQAYRVPLETPFGEAESISSLVSYLCKPESHFITGQSLNVCGAAKFD